MDQDSFESGFKLGLDVAIAALERGERLSDLRRYVADIEGVARRRKREAEGCREMVRDDIFLRMRMAVAADFGLPNHPIGAER